MAIEEKIDGANIGFSLAPGGSLRIQQRGDYLHPPYKGQFSGLKTWLDVHGPDLEDFLQLERHRLQPRAMTTVFNHARALQLLRAGSGNPTADFRDVQLQEILAVCEAASRVLLVQKTGWGKSFIYFIACRLLRDAGRGSALLITILMAFLEATAQQLTPCQPPVVMVFSGVLRQGPTW